ncbi:esterase [Gammaproteobacteria bacterium]|nr:esterase [Gammaproteobacteria bacterium]
MNSSLPLIVYIHGFNSSPASEKARNFIAYCKQFNAFNLQVPALSHNPEVAIEQLEKLISNGGDTPYLLVGSSLGGYYATYLGEKYACRAALINPAVSPVKHLGEGFLGPQKNLYSGEKYEFTREYGMFLATLDVDPLQHPENYLLLLQTGDEVLDHHLALERYAGSLQVVQEGGSHRFEGFDNMIAPILEFAKNGTLGQETMAAMRSI